jgi:hypothetical protein
MFWQQAGPAERKMPNRQSINGAACRSLRGLPSGRLVGQPEGIGDRWDSPSSAHDPELPVQETICTSWRLAAHVDCLRTIGPKLSSVNGAGRGSTAQGRTDLKTKYPPCKKLRRENFTSSAQRSNR